MARRRMFSLNVINDDNFYMLPHAAQLFYFHLCLQADDEGFVQNSRTLLRILDIQPEQVKVLEEKGYIHRFESGVLLILHWLQHNTIKKDRSTQTTCLKERSMVETAANKMYVLLEPERNQSGAQTEPKRNQDGGQPEPQNRADKNREEKSSLEYSTLPLKNGSEFAVSQEKADEWQGKYPNLNLSHSFMNMRNWLLENPNRQREESRMDAFITNWLNNEQNRYGRRSVSYGQAEQASEVTPVLGTVL